MITNEQKMNPFYPTPCALGEDKMTIEEAFSILTDEKYIEAIRIAIKVLKNDIEFKEGIRNLCRPKEEKNEKEF